jgi:hypothetical protein
MEKTLQYGFSVIQISIRCDYRIMAWLQGQVAAVKALMKGQYKINTHTHTHTRQKSRLGDKGVAEPHEFSAHR